VICPSLVSAAGDLEEDHQQEIEDDFLVASKRSCPQESARTRCDDDEIADEDTEAGIAHRTAAAGELSDSDRSPTSSVGLCLVPVTV